MSTVNDVQIQISRNIRYGLIVDSDDGFKSILADMVGKPLTDGGVRLESMNTSGAPNKVSHL